MDHYSVYLLLNMANTMCLKIQNTNALHDIQLNILYKKL